jgi:hypothetical protein
MIMRIAPLLAVAIVLGVFVFGTAARGQITIDGRYWSYRGERVLLLGGWNHGHNPFIDHDTDNDRDNQGVSTPQEIAQAMDLLAASGGNCLRCVFDPGMASGIQGMPFCGKAAGLYDLNVMDGPFWRRLDTFLSEANRRKIIVQLEIWDRFDLIDGSWGSWPVSPWNPNNNVNYTSESSGLAASYRSYKGHPFLQGVPGHPVYEAAPQARRKKYDVVRGYQEKFMAKLMQVSLAYDNVLYCMNNETHEDLAWGQYWMEFIKRTAKSQGKQVLTTDMIDDAFDGTESRGLVRQLRDRATYDYVDISQINSRHADESHWNTLTSVVGVAEKADPPCLLHMTKIYGNDLALDGRPWSRFRPGDTDNGIEEWWRNLLAGVAGVRFHRPTAGIGLYPEARACMTATRKVESVVKFWDVSPAMELLTRRETDEAYLAADPGKAYILYFTKMGAGSVGLKLDTFSGETFELRWVNVDTGDSGPTRCVSGGSTVTIERPDATAHWVATVRTN